MTPSSFTQTYADGFSPGPKKHQDERNARIMGLWDAGLSFTQIGARLGVGRGLVAGVVWRETNVRSGRTARGLTRKIAAAPGSRAWKLANA